MEESSEMTATHQEKPPEDTHRVHGADALRGIAASGVVRLLYTAVEAPFIRLGRHLTTHPRLAEAPR